MRDLAKLVSTLILGIGGLGAVILLIAGFSAFDDYGGSGWLLIGGAIATFIGSATSACTLSLLASMDERLQAAGYLIASDTSANRSEDHTVLNEQFGAPGMQVAAESDDDPDPDLESRLNFLRTHGKN